MNFTQEQIKAMDEEYALKKFLEVEAPDRTDLGNLYYNKKGEGLLDTFRNGSEFHKHQEGERTYFTNETGEVFDVDKIEPYILTNQTRAAEDEEDFQEIYSREFKASGLMDNPEEHLHFKKEILSKKVKGLIEIHTARVGETKINAPITFLAKRFLDFLQEQPTDKRIKAKNNTPVSLEDLFRDNDKYHETFRELEEDGILKKEGGVYSINQGRIQGNGVSELRAICALGYLLRINNYLIEGDTQLVAALSSLFKVEISKGTYSRAKNQCFKNGGEIAEGYFTLFYCLKEQK